MEEAWEGRLSAAASAVEAALDLWEDEVEARDAIILEAIDGGARRGEVATWAHLSPVRITQIVARRASS